MPPRQAFFRILNYPFWCADEQVARRAICAERPRGLDYCLISANAFGEVICGGSFRERDRLNGSIERCG